MLSTQKYQILGKSDAYEKLRSKIHNCSTEHGVVKCLDCGKYRKRVTYTCTSNFCWNCRITRFRRNFNRLMSKQIYSKKLFHLVIGFPLTKRHDKELFAGHRKTMAKFVKLARAYGFKIRGFRVRDVTTRSYNGVTWYYFHYHLALLGEVVKGVNINKSAVIFNRLIQKASNGQLKIVKSVGYKTRRNLFSYFAKRQAGMFGHKDFYGFKDIMSLDSYFNNIHNTRHLVQLGFPKGLTCNSAPDGNGLYMSDGYKKCPYCDSPRCTKPVFLRYARRHFKPPPFLTDGSVKNHDKIVKLLASAKSGVIKGLVFDKYSCAEITTRHDYSVWGKD